MNGGTETTRVVWEDPPAQGRRHESMDVLAVVPSLKGRPGQWARVYTGGGYGVDMRKRHLKAAGCEVTTARADGGTRHLYARWPE